MLMKSHKMDMIAETLETMEFLYDLLQYGEIYLVEVSKVVLLGIVKCQK